MSMFNFLAAMLHIQFLPWFKLMVSRIIHDSGTCCIMLSCCHAFKPAGFMYGLQAIWLSIHGYVYVYIISWFHVKCLCMSLMFCLLLMSQQCAYLGQWHICVIHTLLFQAQWAVHCMYTYSKSHEGWSLSHLTCPVDGLFHILHACIEAIKLQWILVYWSSILNGWPVWWLWLWISWDWAAAVLICAHQSLWPTMA